MPDPIVKGAYPVLVVDDDVEARVLMTRLLESWGYSVSTASNGREAWDALHAKGAPKLVVLDWMMPEMTGIDLCGLVRSSSTLHGLYILMLTVRNRPEHVVEGLEAGADDYVTKPYHSAELRARLAVGVRTLRLQERMAAQVAELEEAARFLGQKRK